MCPPPPLSSIMAQCKSPIDLHGSISSLAIVCLICCHYNTEQVPTMDHPFTLQFHHF